MTNTPTIEQALAYSRTDLKRALRVFSTSGYSFEEYCCTDGTRAGTTSGIHPTDANQCDILHCKSPGNPLPLLTIAPHNLAPYIKITPRSLDAMFISLQLEVQSTLCTQS